MPLPHWSREYFRLESNAKRGGCKFCGKTYANSVTRFKEHLKSCIKIDQSSRPYILTMLESEGIVIPTKRRKLENSYNVEEIIVVDNGGNFETSQQDFEQPPPSQHSFASFLDTAPVVDESEEISSRLVKAFVSGNIPLEFLGNRYFKDFISFIRPDLNLPSLKTFKTKVDEEYNLCREAVNKKILQADYVALSTDGFTDISNLKQININVHAEANLFLVKTMDATVESHTMKYICDEIAKLVTKIGSDKVVAVVCDNAPNNIEAFKILETRFPWMFFIECFAHSLDQLAKDFCKTKLFGDCFHLAVKVSKFFRKPEMATLLTDEQQKNGMNPLKLSIPEVTCWQTFFNCLDRLLYCQGCLETLCCSPILVECCNPKDLTEIKELVYCDKTFWLVLELIHKILKPIFTTISLIEEEDIGTYKTLNAVKSCLNDVKQEIRRAAETHQIGLLQILTEHRQKLQVPLLEVYEMLNPLGSQKESDIESALNLIKSKILKMDKFKNMAVQIVQELAEFRAKTGRFEGLRSGSVIQYLQDGTLNLTDFWCGFYNQSTLSEVYKFVNAIPITRSENVWSIRGDEHSKSLTKRSIESAKRLTFMKHNIMILEPENHPIHQRKQMLKPTDDESQGDSSDSDLEDDCDSTSFIIDNNTTSNIDIER